MSKRINIKLLSDNFQCGICNGYIIDATTLTECLHSFCKSCIVHFIKNICRRCPTCDSTIQDVNSCIKSDAGLQRLIYRMVPSLLDNEIDRRERFYQMEPKHEQFLLNKKTVLNVKLFYKRSKNSPLEDKENVNAKEKVGDKYIQCVAQTPIRVLTKLLRNKFSIPYNYKIRLSHSGHKLNEDESLMQIFTCFLKQKSDLLEIEYEFVKVKIKELDENRISSKGVPCKRIKLFKKNDHYLKLKEKRNAKCKLNNFSSLKMSEVSSPNKVENSAINNDTNVIDQPLDLTINK